MRRRYLVAKTKSIRDIINKRPPVEEIHSLIEEKDYFNAVLQITEYGYRRFFQEYRVFLGDSYRPYIADLYWDEAFDAFISQPYCQLWMGLELPPKEKKKNSKYEWFDSLVLGQNY